MQWRPCCSTEIFYSLVFGILFLGKKQQSGTNNFGFMSDRGTTDDILFALRQRMEKHRGHQKGLHMICLDLENTYDRVSRVTGMLYITVWTFLRAGKLYITDRRGPSTHTERYLSAFDDAVMGHFVDHLSRDVQPKGCDVTVLKDVRRRHILANACQIRENLYTSQ